jgi:Xaa-Pro aminopeptidase
MDVIMDRLTEINLKHEQIKQLLAKHKADALWLRRIRNIAWFTAGADASIPADTDYGAYSVVVTLEKRVIVTNNIELTRLEAEEQFGALGFEFHSFPWHEAETPTSAHMLTDEGEVEAAIQILRMVMTEGEQARLRALGSDAAAAIEEAARAVRPGDTEWQIAARMDAAARSRGGLAIVALIGTDERISQHRHPLITDKRLEKYAMLVMCMRRGGLIVSCTRLVHIGAAPAELHDKLQRIAAIDATVIKATQVGRSLGAVFADLQAAYAAYGEDGQWQFHHQGGPAGYGAREIIATPESTHVVRAHEIYAWNPSIVGAKSEDTILVNEGGFEIVTAPSAAYPSIEVNIGGQVIRRAGLLEL